MKADTVRSLKSRLISLRTCAVVWHCLLGAALALTPSAQAGDSHYTDPQTLLNALHDHAATANWDKYFTLFGKKAVFIGTDASEVWTVPEFKTFALKTKGWKYTVKSRQFQMNDTGNVIWFHELLWNKSYGETRGTGTLLKTDKGWKIAQYSLTFPVPNAIAKKVVATIKDHQTAK